MRPKRKPISEEWNALSNWLRNPNEEPGIGFTRQPTPSSAALPRPISNVLLSFSGYESSPMVKQARNKNKEHTYLTKKKRNVHIDNQIYADLIKNKKD